MEGIDPGNGMNSGGIEHKFVSAQNLYNKCFTYDAPDVLCTLRTSACPVPHSHPFHPRPDPTRVNLGDPVLTPVLHTRTSTAASNTQRSATLPLSLPQHRSLT